LVFIFIEIYLIEIYFNHIYRILFIYILFFIVRLRYFVIHVEFFNEGKFWSTFQLKIEIIPNAAEDLVSNWPKLTDFSLAITMPISF